MSKCPMAHSEGHLLMVDSSKLRESNSSSERCRGHESATDGVLRQEKSTDQRKVARTSLTTDMSSAGSLDVFQGLWQTNANHNNCGGEPDHNGTGDDQNNDDEDPGYDDILGAGDDGGGDANGGSGDVDGDGDDEVNKHSCSFYGHAEGVNTLPILVTFDMWSEQTDMESGDITATRDDVTDVNNQHAAEDVVPGDRSTPRPTNTISQYAEVSSITTNAQTRDVDETGTITQSADANVVSQVAGINTTSVNVVAADPDNAVTTDTPTMSNSSPETPAPGRGGRNRLPGRPPPSPHPPVVDFGFPDDLTAFPDDDAFEFELAYDPGPPAVVTTVEPTTPVPPSVAPVVTASNGQEQPNIDAASSSTHNPNTAVPSVEQVPPHSGRHDMVADLRTADLSSQAASPFATQGASQQNSENTIASVNEGSQPRQVTDDHPVTRSIPGRLGMNSLYACTVDLDPSGLGTQTLRQGNDDTTAESLSAQISDVSDGPDSFTNSVLVNNEDKGKTPVSSHTDSADRIPQTGIQSVDGQESDPRDVKADKTMKETSPHIRQSQTSQLSEEDKEQLASAEHDFGELSNPESSGPVISQRQRTEQDADALLEEVISGKGDKTMGPNSMADSAVSAGDIETSDNDILKPNTGKDTGISNPVTGDSQCPQMCPSESNDLGPQDRTSDSVLVSTCTTSAVYNQVDADQQDVDNLDINQDFLGAQDVSDDLLIARTSTTSHEHSTTQATDGDMQSNARNSHHDDKSPLSSHGTEPVNWSQFKDKSYGNNCDNLSAVDSTAVSSEMTQETRLLSMDDVTMKESPEKNGSQDASVAEERNTVGCLQEAFSVSGENLDSSVNGQTQCKLMCNIQHSESYSELDPNEVCVPGDIHLQPPNQPQLHLPDSGMVSQEGQTKDEDGDDDELNESTVLCSWGVEDDKISDMQSETGTLANQDDEDDGEDDDDNDDDDGSDKEMNDIGGGGDHVEAAKEDEKCNGQKPDDDYIDLMGNCEMIDCAMQVYVPVTSICSKILDSQGSLQSNVYEPYEVGEFDNRISKETTADEPSSLSGLGLMAGQKSNALPEGDLDEFHEAAKTPLNESQISKVNVSPTGDFLGAEAVTQETHPTNQDRSQKAVLEDETHSELDKNHLDISMDSNHTVHARPEEKEASSNNITGINEQEDFTITSELYQEGEMYQNIFNDVSEASRSMLDEDRQQQKRLRKINSLTPIPDVSEGDIFEPEATNFTDHKFQESAPMLFSGQGESQAEISKICNVTEDNLCKSAAVQESQHFPDEAEVEAGMAHEIFVPTTEKLSDKVETGCNQKLACESENKIFPDTTRENTDEIKLDNDDAGKSDSETNVSRDDDVTSEVWGDEGSTCTEKKEDYQDNVEICEFRTASAASEETFTERSEHSTCEIPSTALTNNDGNLPAVWGDKDVSENYFAETAACSLDIAKTCDGETKQCAEMTDLSESNMTLGNDYLNNANFSTGVAEGCPNGAEVCSDVEKVCFDESKGWTDAFENCINTHEGCPDTLDDFPDAAKTCPNEPKDCTDTSHSGTETTESCPDRTEVCADLVADVCRERGEDSTDTAPNDNAELQENCDIAGYSPTKSMHSLDIDGVCDNSSNLSPHVSQGCPDAIGGCGDLGEEYLDAPQNFPDEIESFNGEAEGICDTVEDILDAPPHGPDKAGSFTDEAEGSGDIIEGYYDAPQSCPDDANTDDAAGSGDIAEGCLDAPQSYPDEVEGSNDIGEGCLDAPQSCPDEGDIDEAGGSDDIGEGCLDAPQSRPDEAEGSDDIGEGCLDVPQSCPHEADIGEAEGSDDIGCLDTTQSCPDEADTNDVGSGDIVEDRLDALQNCPDEADTDDVGSGDIVEDRLDALQNCPDEADTDDVGSGDIVEDRLDALQSCPDEADTDDVGSGDIVKDRLDALQNCPDEADIDDVGSGDIVEDRLDALQNCPDEADTDDVGSGDIVEDRLDALQNCPDEADTDDVGSGDIVEDRLDALQSCPDEADTDDVGSGDIVKDRLDALQNCPDEADIDDVGSGDIVEDRLDALQNCPDEAYTDDAEGSDDIGDGCLDVPQSCPDEGDIDKAEGSDDITGSSLDVPQNRPDKAESFTGTAESHPVSSEGYLDVLQSSPVATDDLADNTEVCRGINEDCVDIPQSCPNKTEHFTDKVERPADSRENYLDDIQTSPVTADDFNQRAESFPSISESCSEIHPCSPFAADDYAERTESCPDNSEGSRDEEQNCPDVVESFTDSAGSCLDTFENETDAGHKCLDTAKDFADAAGSCHKMTMGNSDVVENMEDDNSKVYSYEENKAENLAEDPEIYTHTNSVCNPDHEDQFYDMNVTNDTKVNSRSGSPDMSEACIVSHRNTPEVCDNEVDTPTEKMHEYPDTGEICNSLVDTYENRDLFAPETKVQDGSLLDTVDSGIDRNEASPLNSKVERRKSETCLAETETNDKVTTAITDGIQVDMVSAENDLDVSGACAEEDGDDMSLSPLEVTGECAAKSESSSNVVKTHADTTGVCTTLTREQNVTALADSDETETYVGEIHVHTNGSRENTDIENIDMDLPKETAAAGGDYISKLTENAEDTGVFMGEPVGTRSETENNLSAAEVCDKGLASNTEALDSVLFRIEKNEITYISSGDGIGSPVKRSMAEDSVDTSFPDQALHPAMTSGSVENQANDGNKNKINSPLLHSLHSPSSSPIANPGGQSPISPNSVLQASPLNQEASNPSGSKVSEFAACDRAGAKLSVNDEQKLGYHLSPVARVILDTTDQWLNKISDFCKSPDLDVSDPDHLKLHALAAQCKSEIMALSSPSNDTSHTDPSPSRSYPHDIYKKGDNSNPKPQDTSMVIGNRNRRVRPATSCPKPAAQAKTGSLVPRPPPTQRGSRPARLRPFGAKLVPEESAKKTTEANTKEALTYLSRADNMVSDTGKVKTKDSTVSNSSSGNDINLATKKGRSSVRKDSGPSADDKETSASYKTGQCVEVSASGTSAPSKRSHKTNTSHRLVKVSPALTENCAGIPHSDSSSLPQISQAADKVSTSKDSPTVVSTSAQTDKQTKSPAWTQVPGTSRSPKGPMVRRMDADHIPGSKGLVPTNSRSPVPTPPTQQKKTEGESTTPQTPLKRQKLQPPKVLQNGKSKPARMLTMREFERVQADKHLCQAFDRIQRSKACVDCHMDSRVLERTGPSIRRRRERVNYNCLVALENVKFLEMLRYKKSAYSREEQLKDFKKSYQAMIKMGRHSDTWAELKGLDRRGAETKVPAHAYLSKTRQEGGKPQVKQAAGYA